MQSVAFPRPDPRSLEIEIDEGSGTSLADRDGDDPAEQYRRPDEFPPQPAYRQPDQAVIVEAVQCREHDDQQNWKDVLGEERPYPLQFP